MKEQTYRLFFCLLFTLLSAYSNLWAIQYKILTVNDGLSINEVTDVLQDRHMQYLWISSQNGLNRYDGHEIKRLYLPKDSKNVDDYILDIEEDNKKTIWLATNNGLARYSYINSEWYILPKKLRHGQYRQIKFIGKNTVVALKDNNTIVQIYLKSNIVIKENTYHELSYISSIEAINNQLFASTSKGLYTIDNNTVKKIPLGKLNNFHDLRYIKEKNELWANGGGIWFRIPIIDGTTFDKDNILTSSQLFNTSKRIVQIYYHQDNYYLVYREGYEVFKLNNTKPVSLGIELKHLHFRNLAFDNYGNIWGTTWQSGAVMIPFKQPYFKSYHESKFPNGLPTRLVRSFSSINDSLVALGTEQEGIVLFDTQNEKFIPYTQTHQIKGLESFDIKGKIIHCLKKDWKGNIWCGYHVDGFNVAYGTDKERINTAIDHSLWGKRQLICDDFIFQPKKKRVLIFTRRNAISYSYADNSIHKLDRNFDYLNCAMQDHAGKIWVGRQYGISVYDSHLEQEDISIRNLLKKEQLDKLNINCLFQDKQENIWIGTYGKGLFFYNYTIRRIEHLEAPEFLNLKIVYSIIQDKNGMLWIGSNNGLFSYHPEKKQFKRYGVLEGIQGNQFNYKGAYSHTDKDIYFGGIDGFTRFNPYNIPSNEVLSPPIIGEMVVSNELIKHDFLSDYQIPFERNSFEISFFCPNLTSSETYTYGYKLHGYDKTFQYCTPDRPKVQFSNVPAGNYTLEVKVRKPNTAWSQSTFSFPINILPPWYKSNIAYLIYLLLFLIIFWGSIYISRRQMYIQNSLKIAQLEKEKAEQISQAKLQFFSDVAHEIRTPLTLIISPLQEVLSVRTFERPLQNTFEVMYKNAHKLKKLMDELLLFRKAESESITLKLSEYNFLDLLKESALIYQTELLSQHITFTYTDVDCKRVFDYSKMEMVLSNLIHNAIKFSSKGGNISIKVRTESEGLVFSISDSGVGMDKESCKNIFERFFQTQDIENKGFGIGLSLCKKIVEAHSGIIYVESELNQGSTFFIQIPRLKSSLNQSKYTLDQSIIKQSTKPNSNIKTAIKGHILIVEDNTEIQKYIVSIFEAQYKVSLAYNGIEGLEMAKKLLPDIIISDYQMPKMDGVVLCKNIKEDIQISHIPVIILSAFSEVENQIQGLQVGANDYIGKPFDKQILLQKIENLLDFRSKLIASFQQNVQLEILQFERTDQRFLEQLNKVIYKRISDEKLDVIAICTALGIGKTTLNEKLKSMLAITPAEYIKKIRLKEAYRLLTEKRCTVSEVAYSIGFNPSYFSTAFKKQYGVSPAKIRKDNF